MMNTALVSKYRFVLGAGILACTLFTPLRAQSETQPITVANVPEPSGEQDLARQLSNPIASLISIPIQMNFDFNIGPDDGSRVTTNVQPVIPIALNDRTTLIVRTIVPIIYQDQVSGPTNTEFGLGDTVQSFFFSPDPRPGGVIWGVGPVIVYPTATSEKLGGEKWGAGVTGLVLKQMGQDTFGLLANHVWSVAGDDSRSDISTTYIQPFYSHTTKKATTYSLNAEASRDWIKETWNVPVNVSVSQLLRIGKQPVSIGAGARYYVERPAGGPEWGFRLIFTLLFPKK